MANRTEKSIRLLNQRSSEKDGQGRLSELHSNFIRYAELQARIEYSNIMEVRELCQGTDSREAIEALAGDILRQADREKEKIERVYAFLVEKYKPFEEDPSRADLYRRACSIKPVRLFKGPMNSDWDRSRFIWDEIKEGAGKDRAEWYEENKDSAGGSLDDKVFEMVNLMDGQRTLLDIRHIVSCEFDETDIEYVLHFVDDLKKLGLISF